MVEFDTKTAVFARPGGKEIRVKRRFAITEEHLAVITVIVWLVMEDFIVNSTDVRT